MSSENFLSKRDSDQREDQPELLQYHVASCLLLQERVETCRNVLHNQAKTLI